jgi:hypothetical protein
MNQSGFNGSSGGSLPWLSVRYFENQQKFPVDELRKHLGKYVAFNWEGDTILASGTDESEVRAKLVAAGLDPQRAVYSYVDDL